MIYKRIKYSWGRIVAMKEEKLQAVYYKRGGEGNAQKSHKGVNLLLVEGLGEWAGECEHHPVDLCH